MATICVRCQQHAVLLCQECRRALALIDQPSGFGAIARHPEAGRDCRICEHGAAAYCPECFCQETLAHRRALLEHSGLKRRSAADIDAQRERDHTRAAAATKPSRDAGDLELAAVQDPRPLALSWAHAAGGWL